MRGRRVTGFSVCGNAASNEKEYGEMLKHECKQEIFSSHKRAIFETKRCIELNSWLSSLANQLGASWTEKMFINHVGGAFSYAHFRAERKGSRALEWLLPGVMCLGATWKIHSKK
jgi:hypothetical protein